LLANYNFRSCAQIFATGPRNSHETLTASDRTYIKTLTTGASPIPIIIHGAYIDNPWTRSAGAVPNIRREMEIAAEIGIDGVIVHLGAGALNDDMLRTVLMDIATVSADARRDVTLYLEINTAKASPATYETPAKIRRLFERIDGIGAPIRCGLCVDTAHVFSCGVSFADYTPTIKWLNALPDVPTMFHLNDSASTLGSGIDKHEALLRGNIWRAFDVPGGAHDKSPIEDSGLEAILEYATANKSLVILERGDGLAGDLELLARLG